MIPPEAIVLAGGLGTRLRPVVDDRAKPVAPVGERPFIWWILRALALGGVQRATLAIGHKADTVRAALDGEQERLGLELAYSVEDQPLGTAGAARLAASTLDGPEHARLWVVNGDSWVPPMLDALAEAHDRLGATATLRLVDVPDAGRFGQVQLTGQRIRAFREKQPGAGPGPINAGIYLVERGWLLSHFREGRAQSLEHEGFPRLAAHRRLVGVSGPGPFVDIGTPEAYAAAEAILRAELAALEA